MKCDDARFAVSAWLDSELGEENEAALHAHLAECGECRRFLSDVRRVGGVLAAEREEVRRGAEKETARPLLRRKVSIPAASIVLGLIMATLFSFVLGISIAPSPAPASIMSGIPDPHRLYLGTQESPRP